MPANQTNQTFGAKLHVESWTKYDHLATVRKGEAAIVSDCIIDELRSVPGTDPVSALRVRCQPGFRRFCVSVNLLPSVAENPVSRKQPVIGRVMPEISLSLRFQWLVSAHRDFRHAGRDVTVLCKTALTLCANDNPVRRMSVQDNPCLSSPAVWYRG
jgi:hypothetical protein